MLRLPWLVLLGCALSALVATPGWPAARSNPPADAPDPGPGVDLLPVLRSSNARERNAAFRELLKMGKRAEPTLLQALVIDNPATQTVAVQMLAELGIRDATPAIVGFLKAKDPVLQQSAVEGLGRLRDPRAVAPLLERLGQAKGGAKCQILNALGAIGDRQAAPYAESLLQAQDRAVQSCAAGALGAMGDRRGFDVALENAASDDPRVQRAALEALGQIRDDRALGLLGEVLASPKTSNRSAAYIARRKIELRDKGKRDRVRLLTQELEGDEVVQDWAARELADVGDPEAVGALKAHLRGPNGRNRRPILVQLYRLGVPVDGT